MLKKYPLECFLIVVIVLLLLGYGVYLVLPSVNTWWSTHWLFAELVVGVVVAGGTARKWVPLGWAGFSAVSQFLMTWHNHKHELLMIASTRARIEMGHDVEYSNALTGIQFKVSDPYARHGTIVEEIEGEEEQELLGSPIPQAPPFMQMSHLITGSQLVLCYTTEGPAFGTVKDLLSMIITGKPGRGKTTALMYYVTILLKNGAEVFVWDPHGAMNELSVLNDRALPGMPATARVTYLDRKEDIIDSVPTLQSKLAERDELYRDGHKTKHPILLLADELPVLADYDTWIVAQYKAANKKRVKSGDEIVEIPSLIELIRRFVLEARKWEGFFIGSGQTTDAEILPTKVTENASSRIVFFSSDRRARMSGLETDAIKNLLPLIRRAGSGVMIFDCSSWDGPVIGSIPFISVEDMLAYLGVNAVPQLASGVSDSGNDEWLGNEGVSGLETASGANEKIIDDVFPGHGESPLKSISSEKRETIKRLVEIGMAHRDIARIVGLSGRKYHVYQQVCQQEDIAIVGEGR